MKTFVQWLEDLTSGMGPTATPRWLQPDMNKDGETVAAGLPSVRAKLPKWKRKEVGRSEDKNRGYHL